MIPAVIPFTPDVVHAEPVAGSVSQTPETVPPAPGLRAVLSALFNLTAKVRSDPETFAAFAATCTAEPFDQRHGHQTTSTDAATSAVPFQTVTFAGTSVEPFHTHRSFAGGAGPAHGTVRLSTQAASAPTDTPRSF